MTIVIQFSLLCIGVCQQNYFTLTGYTHQIPDSTKVYLSNVLINERIDSTWIIDNQFYFEGNASPYLEAFLLIQHDDGFDYCSLFLENQNIQFDARQVEFRNAKIKGSLLQNQASELFNKTRIWEDSIIQVQREILLRSEEKNSSKLDSLFSMIVQFEDELNAITKNFIQDHPDYLISVQSLTYLKHELPKVEIQQLYEGLAEKMKATNYGQSIKLWLMKSIELSVGDVAPDFQLKDLNNEPLRLSNITSTYTLLEFGASSCGPCRKENPILLKAYQQFQDQGLEIVSVWLDKKKDHWEKTVKEDQMIWISLCDFKGYLGEVPIIYSVNFIPTNYLLDKNRKIVAMNVRGEELLKELASLFKETSNKSMDRQ